MSAPLLIATAWLVALPVGIIAGSLVARRMSRRREGDDATGSAT